MYLCLKGSAQFRVYLSELPGSVSPQGGREEPTQEQRVFDSDFYRRGTLHTSLLQHVHTPPVIKLTIGNHSPLKKIHVTDSICMHFHSWQLLVKLQTVAYHHPETWLLKINLCKHISLYNLYIIYISFICVYIDINTHTHTHTHTNTLP